MKTIQPKTYHMMSGGVALLALVLMYFTHSANTDTSERILALQREQRDEKDVQNDFASTQKRVADLKEKLIHLETGVQQAAYIPTLLKELEEYGKQNQMTILQVRPIFVPTANKDNEKKKSAYTELNVNVKARGGYADTLRFLNALKVFPKIVAVRTLSIVPKVGGADAKKTNAPVLEIDLELRAYAFREDEPTNKTDENKTAANGGFLGGNS